MAQDVQAKSAALATLPLAALLLLTCLSSASAQGDVLRTRVHTINQGDNYLQGEDFFLFENDGMEILCMCSTNNPSDMMLLLHDGVPVPQDAVPCVFPLQYQVPAVRAAEHSGVYTCQVSLQVGDVVTQTAGTLTVFDPSALVNAPSRQFGIIQTSTSLQCEGTMPESSVIWQGGLYGNTSLPAGVQGDGGIPSVGLNHEGNYTCEVYYGAWRLAVVVAVEFLVVVPPQITSRPSSTAYLTFPDNRVIPISIGFQSKFRSNTTLIWYKDGSPIPTSRFQTTYGTVPNAMTTLNFEPIRRSDNGVYRLVIENDCPALPQNQRQAEDSFQIHVSVLPAEPLNVSVSSITTSRALLSWSLAEQLLDQAVDEVEGRLSFANGTLVAEWRVEPEVSQSELGLIPGASYHITVSSHNVDGIRASNKVTFQTPDGAPPEPSVVVTRINTSTFELALSVAYTGGGDEVTYVIQYKVLGTTLWEDIAAVNAPIDGGENLHLTINLDNADFVDTSIAFKVYVRNTRGFASVEVQAVEPLDPPGEPTQPIVESSSHNTLVFSVELSSRGTGPILGLIARFTAPTMFDVNFSEPFQPGETVTLRVDDLEPSTLYTFTISAENYGGIGPTSPEVTLSTDPAPPLPPEGLISLVVAIAVVLIVVAVIAIVVVVHLYKRRRRKREYVFENNNVTPAESNHLEAGHEILSHHKKLKPVSTSTASTSSISSPPPLPTLTKETTTGGGGGGGIPNPQYSIATATTSRQMSLTSGESSLHNMNFHLFESDSSSGVSSTVISESDVNFPRYTYNVSPTPGETSLHSSRVMSNGIGSTRESLLYPPVPPNATDV